MPFGLSAGAVFVFLVITIALNLVATEPVSVDITAISILIALFVVESLTTVGIAFLWGL